MVGGKDKKKQRKSCSSASAAASPGRGGKMRQRSGRSIDKPSKEERTEKVSKKKRSKEPTTDATSKGRSRSPRSKRVGKRTPDSVGGVKRVNASPTMRSKKKRSSGVTAKKPNEVSPTSVAGFETPSPEKRSKSRERSSSSSSGSKRSVSSELRKDVKRNLKLGDVEDSPRQRVSRLSRNRNGTSKSDKPIEDGDHSKNKVQAHKSDKPTEDGDHSKNKVQAHTVNWRLRASLREAILVNCTRIDPEEVDGYDYDDMIEVLANHYQPKELACAFPGICTAMGIDVTKVDMNHHFANSKKALKMLQNTLTEEKKEAGVVDLSKDLNDSDSNDEQVARYVVR